MEQEVSSTSAPQTLNVANLAAIIFDFDGTLVDSEPVWKSVYFDLFHERYGVSLSQDMLWANTGNGVDLSIKNISEELGLGLKKKELANVTKALHEETNRRLLNQFPLRAGAVELFEWAASRDIDMAICTASEHQLITRYFDNLGLLHYFSEIFSTTVSDLDKRKPHPYPYLETLKALNVSADRALVIEDSPSGVTSARAAGITTIAIHNPMLEDKVAQAGPMVQLEDFHQVLALLVSS